MNDIAQNIKTLNAAIGDATLISVSKQQPIEKIHAALNAGHRVFGENRVQEARQRWNDIKPNYPDLKLHLIGPLQSNKAKDAVALFDYIHTIDRTKIARAVSKEMRAQGRTVPCFIQVNTGDETQKAGVSLKELPTLLTLCRDECGLNITGLMCIPPISDPPALHFALLQKLAHRYDLPHLSMGMSNDYERALGLGATHIRIGTGVFGARA